MTRRKTLDERLTRLLSERDRVDLLMRRATVSKTSPTAGDDWALKANAEALDALRNLAADEKHRIERKVRKVGRKIVLRNRRRATRKTASRQNF